MTRLVPLSLIQTLPWLLRPACSSPVLVIALPLHMRNMHLPGITNSRNLRRPTKASSSCRLLTSITRRCKFNNRSNSNNRRCTLRNLPSCTPNLCCKDNNIARQLRLSHRCRRPTSAFKSENFNVIPLLSFIRSFRSFLSCPSHTLVTFPSSQFSFHRTQLLASPLFHFCSVFILIFSSLPLTNHLMHTLIHIFKMYSLAEFRLLSAHHALLLCHEFSAYLFTSYS